MTTVLWSLGAVVVLVLALVLYSRHLDRRARRLVPVAGRITQVDGAAIHWTETGGSPPVVLIHGLAAQLQNFGYALEGKLASDYRVIAVDRPGSGYSRWAPGQPRSLAAQARAIAGLLKAEGVGPAIVVGHSLGGAVALALALNHPERVRALALLAPLTQSVGEASGVFRLLAIRSPLLREVLAQTVAAPIARLRNATTVTQVFAPEPVVPGFAIHGGGALGARPAGFRAPSEDVVAASDEVPGLMRRYRELAIPVGVLFGAEDRMMDPLVNGARFVAQAPNAFLRMVPGAGHMLPLTRPDACADLVREVDRMTAPEV